MKGVELTHARVVETLTKLRLGHIAERLDSHLSGIRCTSPVVSAGLG